MTELIDMTLLGVGVLTAYLILWKSWDLFSPRCKPKWGLNATTGAALDEQIERLEQGMTLLATISYSAPFIGLAGTVYHIIEALQKLGASSADISLVAGPIGTALTATLIGIACAIPASVAYNLFSRRIQLLENRAKRRISNTGAL